MKLFVGWLVGALTGIVVAAVIVSVFEIESAAIALLVGVLCGLAFSWAGIDIAEKYGKRYW